MRCVRREPPIRADTEPKKGAGRTIMNQRISMKAVIIGILGAILAVTATEAWGFVVGFIVLAAAVALAAVVHVQTERARYSNPKRARAN
ncbi:putative secreted protein [Corynebacterium otitidis ATCC 51513]|nr:putative secreted protein [Corynebacterium otitidis ATCC 51513]